MTPLVLSMLSDFRIVTVGIFTFVGQERIFLLSLLVWFAQGALLAVVSVGLAARFWNTPGVRWGLLITGWIGGWLASSPMQVYTSAFHRVIAKATYINRFVGLSQENLLKSLVWPLQPLLWPEQGLPQLKSLPERLWEVLWVPTFVFGLTSLLYYGCLVILRRLYSRRLGTHLVIGCLSGCVGQVMLIMAFWDHTFLSPWRTTYVGLERLTELLICGLLGSVWGLFVGFGLWKSQHAPKISSA